MKVNLLRVMSPLPWFWIGVLPVVLAFPFVAKDYTVFQATMICAYAIALLGLNILTGFNGQISLGHGAFFALGAYSAAILIDRFGVPYGLAIVGASLACLCVGYLFGLPALKLEGLYLALATFALGVATPQLLKYRHLESWTGGTQGIVLVKPDAPFGLALSSDQWLFFVAVAVTAVLFGLARNLLHSGIGCAIAAIRENPIAARAAGVNTSHYKSCVFAISAMFTGVGGAISAIAVQFVSPDSYSMFLSISLLVGVVVGGVGTLSGAFYGAVFIMFVPSVAEKVSKAAPWAVYGAILLFCVFLMPGGFASLLHRIRRSAQPIGVRVKKLRES